MNTIWVEMVPGFDEFYYVGLRTTMIINDKVIKGTVSSMGETWLNFQPEQ